MTRLREVQRNFRFEVTSDPSSRLADAVDSMGLVELVGVLAEDFDVSPEAIDEAVGHTYGTIAEVAHCLHSAGFAAAATISARWKQDMEVDMRSWSKELNIESQKLQIGREAIPHPHVKNVLGWLVSTSARLPEKVQFAAEINEILHRPPGWLESHAGIRKRRVWGDEDPIAAACQSARECLRQAGLSPAEVGALLVTSEAPPTPVGLAAALHHQLQLSPETIALEIGGACTGFLAAWWAALKFLPSTGAVLIISIESHSRHLALGPGPAGEGAALFGDAAAACVLCDRPSGGKAVPIRAIMHQSDGSGAGLLQVEGGESGYFELHMHGVALAGRAVRAMAQSVRDLAERQGLQPANLSAVVVHGGNGRLPNLIAIQLNLPPDRIWSQTANTGNLGSASLPVAWAMHPEWPTGPIAWTAVGAGLTWAAALTGSF
jgi:3-oxoacyl-[acyl-carrier-protein] synthase-3